MHFVYQTRDIVRGKRKRGKMLGWPIIHIMDGDKTICGFRPHARVRERDGRTEIVESGARLLRLTDEQMRAWLFSRENSGSFSAEPICATLVYTG